MTHATLLLLALAAPAADADAKDAKKAPPAQVVVTAEIACLHCTFGEGDGCAACLKIDDQTPIVLAGKGAEELTGERFSKKVLVARGKLSVNKDKRMVLTLDESHFLSDKDKGKVPEVGQARVVGDAICASCDLKLTKDCNVTVANAAAPVILAGKEAQRCPEPDPTTVTAVGRPYVDKDGLLRLELKSMDLKKKADK
jgi:hypothetical protein